MIGQTVSHYRITRELGSGGMGVVYEAVDTKLDRTVALKFLPPESTRDPVAKARFVREAKAVSALDHPNVCTVYEIDETENGQMFLAMTCYQGETLKARISRAPLSLAEALEIAKQVAKGLTAAHDQGITHRDIKPANLFLTATGIVKILDFGLAKPEDQTQLTRTGTTLGTVKYFSPEQARGEGADHRSDLWGLGVVLYEMVTGRVPFQGEFAQAVIFKILNEEMTPPDHFRSDIPPELERIIGKCLAKPYHQRYQHAKEMIRDLDALSRILATDQAAILQAKLSGTVPEFERGSSSHGQIAGAPLRTSTLASLGRPRLSLMLAALVVIFGATVWFLDTKRAESSIKTMAVLTRLNSASSAEKNYVCDLLAARLNATLSQLPQLDVQSQQAVRLSLGNSENIVELGTKLDVDAVLTADLREAGGQLIVAVEVTMVKSGVYIWGKVFRSPLEDASDIYEDIAFDVAENLQLRLDAEDKQRLSLINKYNRATDYWGRRTEVDLHRAIGLFEQIISEDPGFAEAHAGMASSYILLSYYGGMPANVAYERAREASQAAIKLNRNLAEAHAAFGLVLRDYDRDWKGACKEFEWAIQLDPQSASSLQWYAELLASVGRFDEAETTILAAENADPTDLGVQAVHGWILMCAGKTGEAMNQLRTTLTKKPNFHLPHWWLGDLYTVRGEYEEAINSLTQAVVLWGRKSRPIADLACAHALNGDNEKAQQLLMELRSLADRGGDATHYECALVYVGLGEMDRALEELEAAFMQQRSWQILAMGIDPLLKPLHDDDRYRDLLKRVGLPEN